MVKIRDVAALASEKEFVHSAFGSEPSGTSQMETALGAVRERRR